MKIGVIGLGSIGSRHANNLVALGHEVYCFDPAFPDGLPQTRIGPLAAAMDGIDAYVICTPTPQHAADIEYYAKTGKPLFVEKPVVHEFVVLPDQVKMVGYNLRYHACVDAARIWLQNEEIGTPLWANFTVAQFNEKPAYRRDGVILNWSHEIDLALHLLGPAQIATSTTRLNGDGQDVLSDICLVHYPSNAASVIHLDYLTSPELRQSIIVGDNGQIIIDLVSRNAWLRDRNGIRDHVEGHDSFDLNYREEIGDFIDLINGKPSGVHCTAEQAIEVVKICQKVRASAGL